VVYHGSISALRQKAPAQAHKITTTDNPAAVKLAEARGLEVAYLDGGLAVRGEQGDIDELVADIVGAGIAVRGLSLDETPLEALFFMLTESAPDAPTHDLDPSATSGALR
jgi:ABC-2 type transport system ATP-binding protein